MVLTGRLVRDAELKTFPSGTAFLSFSIANNTGYGNYAKVSYFNCKLIGKGAEALTKYMLKGQLVGFSGELTANDWTGKDGTKHHDWELTTMSVKLLGGKKETTTPSHTDNPPMHDEIPEDITF